jgi:hypothetical protein
LNTDLSSVAHIEKKEFVAAVLIKKGTAANTIASLICGYVPGSVPGVPGNVIGPAAGPVFCSRHALAPFSTAIQLEASWVPSVTNPLKTCFCLLICFVIVLLLSANAGDANVPTTKAAAANTATNARVVWFILLSDH